MSDLVPGNESVATRFMFVKGLLLLAFQRVEALLCDGTTLWNSIEPRKF